MTEQQASELQQARATARQEAIAEMTTRINEAERRASEAENLAKERIAELEHQMGDLQVRPEFTKCRFASFISISAL